jgi:hypothetical protein
MAETIYTKALVRAAEAHGSTQGLASFLHVPENTLLRWMAGRAQMPLQAFVKVIELLARQESLEPQEQAPAGRAAEKLQFNMGDLQARCARCDGTVFVTATPGAQLRYTSALLCASCGERVVHGELICQLARDAVHHSRAVTAARARRRRSAPKPAAQPRAGAAGSTTKNER